MLNPEESNSRKKDKSSMLIFSEDTREVSPKRISEISEKISQEVLWDHQVLSIMLINIEPKLRHRLLNKKLILMILLNSLTIRMIPDGNKLEDGLDLLLLLTMIISNSRIIEQDGNGSEISSSFLLPSHLSLASI